MNLKYFLAPLENKYPFANLQMTSFGPLNEFLKCKVLTITADHGEQCYGKFKNELQETNKKNKNKNKNTSSCVIPSLALCKLALDT